MYMTFPASSCFQKNSIWMPKERTDNLFLWSGKNHLVFMGPIIAHWSRTLRSAVARSDDGHGCCPGPDSRLWSLLAIDFEGDNAFHFWERLQPRKKGLSLLSLYVSWRFDNMVVRRRRLRHRLRRKRLLSGSRGRQGKGVWTLSQRVRFLRHSWVIAACPKTESSTPQIN